MATEKTTGRRAVDCGDQVAGLHNVCDCLVGAVAEGLDEHSAAGFISRRADDRPDASRPAHPDPSKPEQPA